MNKFYVTEEIAEKLKTKGYPIIQYYHQRLTTVFPRIDEVLAWLREEKKRFVVIHPTGHVVHYYYTVHNLARSFDTLEYTQSFATYEQAAIAGIEYCLDNLI
jgi:hypothetical protein